LEECRDYFKKFDACMAEKVPASERPALMENRKALHMDLTAMLADPAARSNVRFVCTKLIEKQLLKRYGCIW
jgi:hypothetical protein